MSSPNLLILATMVLAVAVSSACHPSYSYLRANKLSLDEVCPGGQTPTSELLLDDECGVKLTRMTGEAACRASNGDGCAVASMLTLNSVSLSQSFTEEAFAGDNDRAYNLASQGCALDNESACFLQAQILLQGDSPREKSRGFQLMDSRCWSGMGAICYTMGAVFEENATALREKKEAFKYYRQSCETGDPDGCYALGRMWEKGFGTSTNMTEAKKFYGRACDLNHKEGCVQVDREPPKDDRELVNEWARITTESFVDMAMDGCKRGFKHGCTFAGRLIDRGEIRGRYVGDEKAVAFYQQGCQQGAPESCHSLAIRTHAGAGVEANTKTAAQLAQKACDAGLDKSCTLHRDYLYRLFDQKKAESYAQTCEAPESKERGRACYLAGQAFAYGVNFDAAADKALELQLQGCELDYGDACEAAGRLLDEGEKVDQDTTRARQLYEKACDNGADFACHRLGVRLKNGEGVDKDVERAASLLERACERGWSEACGELGALYEEGKGVREDKGRAERLYRQGCATGHIASCTDLAHFYVNTGTEESMRQAFGLYKLGCANDDADACNEMGFIYSQFEDAESQTKAVEFFQKSCLLESGRGCSNLGLQYYWGDGAAKDRGKAVDLYTKACEMEFMLACERLADIYRTGEGAERDPARAAKLYGQACSSGEVSACHSLARMKLAGVKVDYEPKEALALYVRACEKGDDGGCVTASRLLTEGVHVERSLPRAYKLLEQGCEADGAASCDELADRLRIGFGVEADVEKADAHAQQSLDINRNACEANQPETCDHVAHQIAHGKGPKTDFSAAREFLRQKCEADVAPACREIAEQKSTGELFPRNREEGVDTLLTMCNKDGDATACFLAAYYMRRGKSDELRLTRSVDIYQKLCDAEYPGACHSLGTAYLHGLGVDADRTRALNILKGTCTEDESVGCLSYTSAMLIGGDTDNVESLYERSAAECRANHAAGCIRQAEFTGYGVVADQDLGAARKLYAKACDAGDLDGCARAEAIEAHQARLAKAKFETLAAACTPTTGDAGTTNDSPACVAAGLAAEYGIAGAEITPQRAAGFYDRACEAGSRLGCQLRVAMHQHAKAPLIGDDYYDTVEKACQLGSQDYCFVRGRQFASHDWDEGLELVSRACKSGSQRACLWLTANGEPVE